MVPDRRGQILLMASKVAVVRSGRDLESDIYIDKRALQEGNPLKADPSIQLCMVLRLGWDGMRKRVPGAVGLVKFNTDHLIRRGHDV